MRESRVGSVNERFSDRYVIDAKTGCWNWTATLNGKGYGVIGGLVNGQRYAPPGQNLLAHRVSWILYRGEIPDGEGAHGTVIMHKCDNPKCVNPDHLCLGSQSDNVKDMITKGRKVAGEWQLARGIDHFRSAFKDQADIDLICSTKGKTKELAERYGVDQSAIKRLRSRNGKGSDDPEKFASHKLSKEAIEHIRSTPAGTRGLGKLYGVGKTAIANARKGITYAD